jgi:hypothetical protein
MRMVLQVVPSLGSRRPETFVTEVGPNLSLGWVCVNGGVLSSSPTPDPPPLLRGRRNFFTYIWTMGRTSIAPTIATGHFAAQATASSRSLASIT